MKKKEIIQKIKQRCDEVIEACDWGALGYVDSYTRGQQDGARNIKMILDDLEDAVKKKGKKK